jgi:heat shock protein HslJ
MKFLSIIIVSLSCAVTAFGQQDSLTKENNVLTGKWKLIEFKNISTGEITDTASVQDNVAAFYKHVRLSFHDSAGIGEIKGKSFCNNVGGYYKIYPNNKITSLGVGGTQVWCLYEGKLQDAFHAASSYKRNSDTLSILYNSDLEEMIFALDK